ncbi:hypothetical protein [Rugosimonospora africana]|nr:hypothetical protein [Rugosimonospora africana]
MPVPWSLVRVEDGGRRIVISVAAAPGSVKGVRIAETPSDVTLTVYRTPPPGGFRTLIMVRAISAVELDPPLGTRRLRGAEGDR